MNNDCILFRMSTADLIGTSIWLRVPMTNNGHLHPPVTICMYGQDT